MSEKTAIVLFNLGGPDNPEAVRPFLFNLFHDPAIIGVPQPLRFFLAKLISSKREKEAQEIYEQMGGKSPLLEQTQDQRTSLNAALGEEYQVFIAMRYWHPLTEETIEAVKAFDPHKIILLPLYPQYSTTTSGSSIKKWKELAKKSGIDAPIRTICCYPTEDHFIRAHSDLLHKTIKDRPENVRVLFSAHGLPEAIIRKGDPYQWQVEQTVQAILDQFHSDHKERITEHVICYQSRVGPLKWITPATDEEILKAAHEGKHIVVVPIAFVSEHSETLVELDIEYRELAEKNGAASYHRVPALQTHPEFIASLKTLCTLSDPAADICSHLGDERLCPAEFGQCPKQQTL